MFTWTSYSFTNVFQYLIPGIKDKKHEVLWKDNNMPFDGIPCMILSRKEFDCQHGCDRKAAQKRKYEESKKQVDTQFSLSETKVQGS